MNKLVCDENKLCYNQCLTYKMYEPYYSPRISKDKPVSEPVIIQPVSEPKPILATTKPVETVTLSEAPNQAIVYIQEIVSSISPDSSEQLKIIKAIKKLFDTDNPVIIKNKLQKYYSIADYGLTVLKEIVKTEYGTDKDDILSFPKIKADYTTWYENNKNTLPIKVVDKGKTNPEKTFYLLYLTKKGYVYNTVYLDKLIKTFTDSVKDLP